VTTSEQVRRPLSELDSAAVIGVPSILEGELLGEALDVELAARLRDRFVGAGSRCPMAPASASCDGRWRS
jgi:hypothetical protein